MSGKKTREIHCRSVEELALICGELAMGGHAFRAYPGGDFGWIVELL